MNQPTTRSTARPVTPMGILVQQLETIRQQAVAANVPPDLQTAIAAAHALAAGLDPYLEQCTTPESTALAALAQSTASADWSQHFAAGQTVRQLEQEMLSGHLEGQLLKHLVGMVQAKRILEIGLFTGYSALAMAEALPPDGCLIACEVDAYVADLARASFARSSHGSKITICVAPALDTLHQLADAHESFDWVFIDADKQEYVAYFHLLLDRELLAPNGVICVDNTLLQGQPYLPPAQRTPNGAAIAQFNQVVANDPRVEQVLIPVRDGLTLIRRKKS